MKTRKNKKIIFTHFASSKIDKFKEPKKLGISPKPKGCLWFGCDKEWETFVEDQMPKSIKKSYKYKYTADLDLSNILILKTKKDILDFTKKYVKKQDEKYLKGLDKIFETFLIDWDKVREETKTYGIYIEKANILPIKFEIGWYYSIDVCSVAIWDNHAIISMKEEKL